MHRDVTVSSFFPTKKALIVGLCSSPVWGMALVPVGQCSPNRIPSISLSGLAEQWEATESIRRAVLINRRVLIWLSAAKTGVPSFSCASMNFEVLELFFKRWVTVSPSKRTVAQPTCVQEACVILQALANITKAPTTALCPLQGCTALQIASSDSRQYPAGAGWLGLAEVYELVHPPFWEHEQS